MDTKIEARQLQVSPIRPEKIKKILDFLRKKIGKNVWGSFGIRHKVHQMNNACMHNNLNVAESSKFNNLRKLINRFYQIISTDLNEIEREMDKLEAELKKISKK